MTFLIALKTLLASKVVAVGAGTALVAGGVAVAAPDVFLLEPASDSELEIADVEEEPGEDETEDGEATVPADGEPTNESDDDTEPAPAETNDDEVNGEGSDDESPEDAPDTERVLEDDESGPSEQGLANRSATANAVQDVIAERKADPEAFESGRQFGQAVSEAARGANGSSDKAARGEGANNGNRGNARGGGEDEATPEDEPERLEPSSVDQDAKPGNGNGKRPAHAGGPKR